MKKFFACLLAMAILFSVGCKKTEETAESEISPSEKGEYFEHPDEKNPVIIDVEEEDPFDVHSTVTVTVEITGFDFSAQPFIAILPQGRYNLYSDAIENAIFTQDLTQNKETFYFDLRSCNVGEGDWQFLVFDGRAKKSRAAGEAHLFTVIDEKARETIEYWENMYPENKISSFSFMLDDEVKENCFVVLNDDDMKISTLEEWVISSFNWRHWQILEDGNIISADEEFVVDTDWVGQNGKKLSDGCKINIKEYSAN